MADPDARKTLGFIVVLNDGTLATDIVFGTKHRAENFQNSYMGGLFTAIYKVRSESERDAHKWGEPAKK